MPRKCLFFHVCLEVPLFTTSLSLSLTHTHTFNCNLSVGAWLLINVVNFCILRSDLPLNGNGQNKKLPLTLPMTLIHLPPPPPSLSCSSLRKILKNQWLSRAPKGSQFIIKVCSSLLIKKVCSMLIHDRTTKLSSC